MRNKRIWTLGIQGLSGAILVFVLWSVLSVPPPITTVPSPGERLNLREVSGAFQTELPSEPAWLLVLTDGCEACLLVSEQLPDIGRAAALNGVQVVPLIVGVGGDENALTSILREHGFETWGIGGREGFDAVRTWVVPTLIALDRRARVIGTTNARIFAPSWVSLSPQDWAEVASAMAVPAN